MKAELIKYILDNPDISVHILKEPYPRAPHRVFISGDNIVIDFGWDALQPDYNPFDNKTHRLAERFVYPLDSYGDKWCFDGDAYDRKIKEQWTKQKNI